MSSSPLVPIAPELTEEMEMQRRRPSGAEIDESSVERYEIHITVGASEVDLFRHTCEKLYMKPLYIELGDPNWLTAGQSMIATSLFEGGFSDAMCMMEMKTIALMDQGLEIHRRKIEAPIWQEFPVQAKPGPDTHCEAHINVTPQQAEHFLVRFNRRLWMSMNKDTGQHIITYRRYNCWKGNGDDAFRDAVFDVNMLLNSIAKVIELPPPRCSLEQSVYDSNSDYDFAWTWIWEGQ